MMKLKNHVLRMCVFASAVSMMPVLCAAQGCGCQSYAAPIAVAPTYTSYYAPQTYSYMPTSVYRAMYQPAVTTAYMPVYQPAVAYSAYSNYAVYRPLFGGWTYRTRLMPYTTYQPVYTAAPVVAYSGYNSYVSYGSYDSCSPCGGGACGTVSYGAPVSGCSSCAAPATTITPAPSYPQDNAPPKTFQEEKVQRPSIEPEPEPELKPIPQTDTHLNSMPAPLLPDPRDRTATRTVYSSARVTLVAKPTQSNDGWQPARD